MPRGVPKCGFKKTKNWYISQGLDPVTKMPLSSSSSSSTVLPTDNDKLPPDIITNETDEQILDRITKRFSVMRRMTEATLRGFNRAMIIAGPPGLGKSHTVTEALRDLEIENYDIVKGFVRPTGLYKLLYEYRNEGSVLVFDDADSIFNDDISLNLLKAACDMNGVRRLSWISERTMFDSLESEIPKRFQFNGQVIFISNYDFDEMIKKNHRFAPHFEALISRSHYIDLSLKTRKDYMVRIKDVIMNSGMLSAAGYSMEDCLDVVHFIESNINRMRELSLRMANKVASIIKMDRNNWQEIAEITCLVQTRK